MIDEEIVAFDSQRSPDEGKRNMQIKDHMRMTCIGDVTSALHSIISQCQTKYPQISKDALNVLRKYIGNTM